MRIAVLSDIHANLPALEAVARDVEAADVDEIWCLGDVVGYGGHPRECLRWTEERVDLLVKGNHDEAVATGDVAWFNPMAAQAARAHAQLLSPAERTRLFSWPLEARRTVSTASGSAEVLVVHASPDDPLHEYVQPADARLGLRRWTGRADIILLGHTHRPFFAQLRTSHGRLGAPAAASARAAERETGWTSRGFEDAQIEEAESAVPLVLVNPGSVGQPRDGDSRAAYLLIDFEAREMELRRVVYDVEVAAQAILKAGLDHLLALRLYEGR